jgi:FdhD protein
MRIDNRFHPDGLSTGMQGQCYDRLDQKHAKEYDITREHLMDLWINEVRTMRLICSPSDLPELILGRLLTEGVISDCSEVSSIYICEEGARAHVVLAPGHERKTADKGKKYVETVPSCCTGNRVYNDLFADASPKAVTPIPWKKEWVSSLVHSFEKQLPLYRKTGGVHSCLLACRERLVCWCEDLGRHNAMDKAIGYALERGEPLDVCMLYSSGRIPTDMVIKAVRAGVPLLATKAAPTDLAVEMARAYGLTLICFARNEKMTVFSGRLPEESGGRLIRNTVQEVI